MLPSVFVSHGAPTLALADTPASRFLRTLGATLGRPRAVLAVSAHWETAKPAVTAHPDNETIHDFGGFPAPLYQLRYPAPGSVALAERVCDLLAAEGLPSGMDRVRGLDHGAWVPLLLMYPQADIPVVELSVQSRLGPAHHLQLGRALAALREEDVLVLGSGSFTHDLRRIRWQEDAALEPDVVQFADWMDAALAEGRVCDLLTYRTKAPHAVRNHPTEEHLLPLYVALGAAGAQPRPERLHSSGSMGVLRMDAYAFH
jgi:4,5-DOPA dioxygenase extradiol